MVQRAMSIKSFSYLCHRYKQFHYEQFKDYYNQESFQEIGRKDSWSRCTEISVAERTVLRGNQTQQGYLRLMTERYTIFSEAGDEYRLQFTTDRSNIIADRILDHLLQDGIEVVEVGLGHVGSTNVTSHRVLQQIYGAAEPQ